MRRPVFWAIWVAFYLNITCGLALISQEKDILHDVLAVSPRFAGLDAAAFTAAFTAATAGVISTVLAVDAVFNAAGRLGFPALSDHCRRRETSYVVIFIMSIAACVLQVVFHSLGNGIVWMILMMLFLVNAGYGGGFSTLPMLLEQHFGMASVSTVHGLALSAWAVAGLSGNQLASFAVAHTSDSAHRYAALIPILAALYTVALAAILLAMRDREHSGQRARREASRSISARLRTAPRVPSA